MDINKRLKELQEEINELKDAQHNHGMIEPEIVLKSL